MSVVYLTTPGTSVRRTGPRLQVFRGKEKVADLRLFGLERLVLVGGVQLTSQATNLLLDNGVDVSFITRAGRLRGSLVSAESPNVYLRLAQFERWKDEAFRVEFARRLAAAKIAAQAGLVARSARNHPESVSAKAASEIDALADKLPGAGDADSIRGLEGCAAAIYYREFAGMLTSVGFPGRKRRPATDPANALLSLGYVLLTNEIGGRIEALGFDPAVGFFHGLRYGRRSLALDLVEPFPPARHRPPCAAPVQPPTSGAR
jgi:CRISPR-associated protein Cas1